MAIVGIVGGLGPESTIDYYRRLLAAWQAVAPGTAPSIIIDSLDAQLALRLVRDDRPVFVDYLLASLDRLAAAGADFAAMTANTAHLAFDELAARSRIELVSIVEVCAEEARRRSLRRPLLLGTRFTMEASFYPEVFARRGISVVVPAGGDRDWIHERYVGELLQGDFRESTRQRFAALVAQMRDTDQIDGVVLGGTELPLLVRDSEIAGVPALDTTALHIAAIVDKLHGGT